MKEYRIGDLIEFKGLNDKLTGYVKRTGFILQINKDGSFLVGNVFIDIEKEDITSAMLSNTHQLNEITIVDRTELVSDIGNL